MVPVGGRFDGLVVLGCPARIDGTVVGRILAADTVWIGPAAVVQGEIEARHLVVGGRITGRARAEGRIALLSTARVSADLEAERLVIADGSFLEGDCRAGVDAATSDDPR